MNNLHGLVYSLLLLALVVVIGLVVLAENGEQVLDIAGASSFADNASNEMQAGVAEIPGWVPLLVIVIMAGVIIGVVRSAFGGGRG